MAISQITGGIFIGGADDVRRGLIRKLSISAVLTVADGLYVDVGLIKYGQAFEYNRIGLRDDGGNDPRLIAAAADVLFDMQSRHERTLCHCWEGQNRSATVIAVCLTRLLGLTLDDAVQYVRDRHHLPKGLWGPRPETVNSVRGLVK